MSIRLKIIFVVIPLLIASVVLAGMSSYFMAASSVTKVAVDFLDFKAAEIEKYADSQWNLLVDNDFIGRADMEQAAKAAVEAFARSILRSTTETIFAIDSTGAVAMRVGPAVPADDDRIALLELSAKTGRGFVHFRMAGAERVASLLPFSPFDWRIFVSEERSTFYGEVETIARTALYILIAASLVGIMLLFFLAGYLTKPIEKVVEVMRRIIESNNLTERVPVMYRDEIGQLSHTFNLMLEELGTAYEQIKHYAFDAVVAQKREMRIRNIFQLYVPKDVIEEVFVNPEKMLVGNNRYVSILFSDIRSFTTISEGMTPDALVNSLNRYFGIMVDVIMEHDGMVDKYIGDAIMAVFGAPVSHGNDALSSVISGLKMAEGLERFNREQIALGAPEFHIGVGINYGEVTVGNIGCDKKMNYTVIGDTVNLASRLEGLTKMYHQPILVTESVVEKIDGHLPWRTVDTVAVKGKTLGVKIMTTRFAVSGTEAHAWKIHEEAVALYYERNFRAAAELFERILQMLPGDVIAEQYLGRAHGYMQAPPPPEWDGVEIMTEK